MMMMISLTTASSDAKERVRHTVEFVFFNEYFSVCFRRKMFKFLGKDYDCRNTCRSHGGCAPC